MFNRLSSSIVVTINEPEENKEIQPFLDILDEENCDGLLPFLPQLFDDWAGFDDLSLNNLPPSDLDLINGEMYAWSNLCEKARSYGYESKESIINCFKLQMSKNRSSSCKWGKTEFPILNPEDMDALGKVQARNNVEEILEIEVFDGDYFENDNVNVYKEQIPHEKTNYILPH